MSDTHREQSAELTGQEQPTLFDDIEQLPAGPDGAGSETAEHVDLDAAMEPEALHRLYSHPAVVPPAGERDEDRLGVVVEEAESAIADDRKPRKTLAMVGGGVVALLIAGGAYAAGRGSDGGEETRSPEVPVSVGEPVDPIERETVVANVCDVLTPDAAAAALNLERTNIMSRSCFSDLPRGIITEVDWTTDSGVFLSALVLDDAVVTANSYRNPDGSLVGFGSFADYHSLQANRYFTFRTSQGQEFQGAMNTNSLRVLVDGYVIAVDMGNDLSGATGAERIISPTAEPRYVELARNLVEQVFETEIED